MPFGLSSELFSQKKQFKVNTLDATVYKYLLVLYANQETTFF